MYLGGCFTHLSFARLPEDQKPKYMITIFSYNYTDYLHEVHQGEYFRLILEGVFANSGKPPRYNKHEQSGRNTLHCLVLHVFVA